MEDAASEMKKYQVESKTAIEGSDKLSRPETPGAGTSVWGLAPRREPALKSVRNAS